MNYDAIIIGSGQGGSPLAKKLADDGRQVAIVESGLLGGTCVNTGCTPTKAMIGSAQIAHYARNAARWGVRAGDVSIDLPAILARKDEIVQRSRSGWEKKFGNTENPRLYRARARFIGPRQVQVGDETIAGEYIFIDTGTAPSVPPIKGLDSARHLTSDSILELRELPRHLIVVGGGYVGLEFGQIFRRFGSEITVVQDGPRILPKEDHDIAQELQKSLEAEGIRFFLNAQVSEVTQEDTEIIVHLGAADLLRGSHLLIATGRHPNTRDLDLEKAEIQTDQRGFIVVDDQLRTTADGVWALGDVNGGPQFTHISYNDFQIVYANVYQGANLSTKTRLLPYAVFTDPALGRVGLTEKEARERGYKLKAGKIPMKWVARAIERGETAGCMKVVVNADDDRILGASILASEGGELVQILSTLMLAEKPYTLLKGAIYIHPTLAEGLFSLMDSVK